MRGRPTGKSLSREDTERFRTAFEAARREACIDRDVLCTVKGLPPTNERWFYRALTPKVKQMRLDHAREIAARLLLAPKKLHDYRWSVWWQVIPSLMPEQPETLLIVPGDEKIWAGYEEYLRTERGISANSAKAQAANLWRFIFKHTQATSFQGIVTAEEGDALDLIAVLPTYRTRARKKWR